jgi:hypothetical protein
VLSSSSAYPLEVTSQSPKKAKDAFMEARLVLVGGEQGASAFLVPTQNKDICILNREGIENEGGYPACIIIEAHIETGTKGFSF